jgi:hypothetical protein
VKSKFGQRIRLELAARCTKQRKYVHGEDLKDFEKRLERDGPFDCVKRDRVVAENLAETHDKFDLHENAPHGAA